MRFRYKNAAAKVVHTNFRDLQVGQCINILKWRDLNETNIAEKYEMYGPHTVLDRDNLGKHIKLSSCLHGGVWAYRDDTMEFKILS